MTPHQDGLDFTWNAWQFVLGNSLLGLHVVLFAAVTWALLRPRRAERPPPREDRPSALVPAPAGADPATVRSA
jgi:hypothetical protein